jgi:hypothetical protein
MGINLEPHPPQTNSVLLSLTWLSNNWRQQQPAYIIFVSCGQFENQNYFANSFPKLTFAMIVCQDRDSPKPKISQVVDTGIPKDYAFWGLSITRPSKSKQKLSRLGLFQECC